MKKLLTLVLFSFNTYIFCRKPLFKQLICKIFLASFFLLDPFNAYAEEAMNTSGLSAYTVPLMYLNSSKKQGVALGTYGYFNIEKAHLFEGSLGFSYLNLSTPLYLENLGFSYSNFQLENNSIKVGGDFLNTSLKSNDQGAVGFLSDSYYVSENFSFGLEGAISSYNYYTAWKPILQISPSITFKIGDYYSSGDFFITAKAYYIRLPEELGAGVILFRRNYFSGELSLAYKYLNIFNISVFGWGGSQVFAVRNNGFTVFNSDEEHFAGYGLSLKYALTEELSVNAGIYNDHFIEQKKQTNTMGFSIPISIDYNF